MAMTIKLDSNGKPAIPETEDVLDRNDLISDIEHALTQAPDSVLATLYNEFYQRQLSAIGYGVFKDA